MNDSSVTGENERPGGTAAQRRAMRSLLRGYGFADGLEASRLADSLLGPAEVAETDGGALLRQAEERIADWLSHAAGRSAAAPPLPPGLARTAFLAAGIARRWPALVLDFGDLPPGLQHAARQALPVPTPPEAPSAMIEQSLAPISLGQAVARWLVPAVQRPARIPLSGRR